VILSRKMDFVPHRFSRERGEVRAFVPKCLIKLGSDFCKKVSFRPYSSTFPSSGGHSTLRRSGGRSETGAHDNAGPGKRLRVQYGKERAVREMPD